MRRLTMLCASAAALALTAAPAAWAQEGGPPPAGPVSEPSKNPDSPYKTAAEHFAALKAAAKGGDKKTWANLPDWSGIYTRGGGAGLKFDPKQSSQFITTAVLTPEYTKRHAVKVEEVRRGVEWDRLSFCLPPGFPRWLTEPFLREFVVRPDQVWLQNEMVNDIRRVYTDGRAHTPESEAYPMWNGDSIGFWRGDTLVVWTNHLKDGQYQRGQPDYSNKVETVEEWRKSDADTLEDRVTVYDPVSLLKPWVAIQSYSRVKDPPNLRIRYWSCEENNNVSKDVSGATNFTLPGEEGYKDPTKFQAGDPNGIQQGGKPAGGGAIKR